MGHHYVPRLHLRRFAIQGRENCVWLYDKQTREFREAGIANVANERGYYDLAIEKALAQLVEAPGKLVIDKLLSREKIDNEERKQLSLFFMVMLSRGPRHRRESLKQIPDALESVLAETETEICQFLAKEPGHPIAPKWLQELEDIRIKFSSEPPQNIIDQIRCPFWSEQTVECIHKMNWHVIQAPPGSYFLTCDTPAHFFSCYGVGTPESEYTITLSKDFALIGERKRSWGIVYEKQRTQIAKEINRRILSHAERFVYSPRKDDWIDTVAQKMNPFLSQIHWQ